MTTPLKKVLMHLCLHAVRPLDATVLSDPVTVLGGPGVNAGLVPTSAAISPAHHTRQEDPPTGAGDRQRAPRVALCADM